MISSLRFITKRISSGVDRYLEACMNRFCFSQTELFIGDFKVVNDIICNLTIFIKFGANMEVTIKYIINIEIRNLIGLVFIKHITHNNK